jgi:hypothetical protein
MTTKFPTYERAMTAKALLLLADALAIKVGSDGIDVITVSSGTGDLEVGRWLHAELVKHKREVIAAIMSENAARTRASS